MSTRAWRALGVITVALGVAVLLMRARGASSDPPPAAPRTEPSVAQAAATPPVTTPLTTAVFAAPAQARLIEAVTPERTDPWAGELVLVGVKTRAVKKPVNVRVQSEDGSPGVVPFDNPGAQGLNVLATTFDREEIDFEVVPVRVGDCGEVPEL